MDETDDEMMEVVDFDVTSEPSTDKNTGTSVPNEFSLNIVSDKQTRDMRDMIQPTSEVVMDFNKFPKKAKKNIEKQINGISKRMERVRIEKSKKKKKKKQNLQNMST